MISWDRTSDLKLALLLKWGSRCRQVMTMKATSACSSTIADCNVLFTAHRSDLKGGCSSICTRAGCWLYHHSWLCTRWHILIASCLSVEFRRVGRSRRLGRIDLQMGRSVLTACGASSRAMGGREGSTVVFLSSRSIIGSELPTRTWKWLWYVEGRWRLLGVLLPYRHQDAYGNYARAEQDRDSRDRSYSCSG